jgi:hypothetical protein
MDIVVVAIVHIIMAVAIAVCFVAWLKYNNQNNND